MEHDARRSEVLNAIGRDRDEAQWERHAANLETLLSNMAQYGNQRTDPVRMHQAFLGDRWSSLVMHLLSGGMLRFTELRRLIGLVSAEHGISQRVLTLKLRVLERDGLLARHVTDDVPPRVEYRLTDLGVEAYALFTAQVRWSERATALIRTARRDYDARHPDGPTLADKAGEDDTR
jgi:DNA-binding HxlR family transcriptional regulator